MSVSWTGTHWAVATLCFDYALPLGALGQGTRAKVPYSVSSSLREKRFVPT